MMDAGWAEDPGLQRERTRLAWRRTGLTLTAVSTGLVRISFAREARTLAALAAALAVLAAGALIEGSLTDQEREPWLERDRSRRGLPLVARANVATVVALSGLGLVLVATT